ncbi:MAG TPA: PBP1A family penicillin-binding protein [Thermoanaerobaculia bacterium]|nr:PBP1A family penicillin-binding protein [Thermoanaerobaculia bacterium]
MADTPDPMPRLSRRGTVVRTAAIVAIALGILVIATAIFVYSQAVGRFEVRRVALPTRIFTDLFPLEPDLALSRDSLIETLGRLGYRSGTTLDKPGDYAVKEGVVSIYIRPFKSREGDRSEQQVSIRFERGRIAEVLESPGGGAVTGAALEPELLTSVLSERLENRRPVKLDQIPDHLVDAVIVTEDVRFWQHPGVDPVGIGRALFRNLRARGVAEGGSTLTQQLVKNYYLTGERTFRRKIVEAFMSLILDAKYSKREILEAYLNDIYLGRDRSISILGVGEAARFYFGKPVTEIDVAEAALLVAMIRAPNNYTPFEHPERALERRNTVLGLLRRHDKIDQQTHDEAVEKPLPKRPNREKSGLASIPYYVDRVMHELARDYGIRDVKGRGLSIYTAIDLEWQNHAAQRVQAGLLALEKSSRRLRRSENPLEGALIAVDVPSGEIRALVGGRNYERSQFNRALAAKRQVGSLFKPFVYLAAFEPSLSGQNITPATLVNDSRFILKRRFGRDWSPRNYGEQYLGVVTVRKALVDSLNAASVRIGLSAGLDGIVRTAHALGVQSELEEVPSLILGSSEITPIEMAEAYTTIARMGSRAPLRAVRFILDDHGRVVGGDDPVEAVQVFPARNVYLAVDIMKAVIREGTGAGAGRQGFRKTAAGKTGTTNDLRDAWFAGFTPDTLALTWIGFDDNAPVGVSGSVGAVPIWARFMRDVTEGNADRDFPAPSGITFTRIDIFSGGLATPFCPPEVVRNQAFKAATAPSFACPAHMAPPPPEPLEPFDPYGLMPEDLPHDPTATSAPPQLEGGIFRPEPPPTTTLPERLPPEPEPPATETAPPPGLSGA